jgi:hypothetical protein
MFRLLQYLFTEELHWASIILFQFTQLNGGDIRFKNNVMYLGVIFDRRMSWRRHIESSVAKALRTYVKNYSPFKSRRLNTSIQLTLHKCLIRLVMTYACPVADAHILKCQRLQNRVSRAIGNLDRSHQSANYTRLSKLITSVTI